MKFNYVQFFFLYYHLMHIFDNPSKFFSDLQWYCSRTIADRLLYNWIEEKNWLRTAWYLDQIFFCDPVLLK